MRKEIMLPGHDLCTGCGVCETICPVNSIHMQTDALDCLYPVIDATVCVQCGACMRHCHALNEQQRNMPQTAYAAWHTSAEERASSASGGIACAVYQYALQHEIAAYGVQYEVRRGARFVPVTTAEDIAASKNSKYVFSECTGVFPDIKQRLRDGQAVCFIGLPCQVSALRSYLGKDYESLLLMDIICHGVTPAPYLEQHIRNIEKKKRKQAEQLYFRDPQHGTENFIMTLGNKEGRFYRAEPRGSDLYATGYHCMLTYRENCYHCKYATAKRVSDITIGDFSGLGRFAPWEGSKASVSCVLISTNTGRRFWEQLEQSGLVSCQERPLEEALKVEKQLIHPSVPHKNRELFKKRYMQRHDFDGAARGLLSHDMHMARQLAAKKTIRNAISGLIPQWAKTVGRRVLRKCKR